MLSVTKKRCLKRYRAGETCAGRGSIWIQVANLKRVLNSLLRCHTVHCVSISDKCTHCEVFMNQFSPKLRLLQFSIFYRIRFPYFFNDIISHLPFQGTSKHSVPRKASASLPQLETVEHAMRSSRSSATVAVDAAFPTTPAIFQKKMDVGNLNRKLLNTEISNFQLKIKNPM